MNEYQAIALERDGATADLVVVEGQVYCSNRREFLKRDIAVVGNRIAALLPDAESVIGPETTVVSAADRDVLPGFIDAHTHADLQLVPERAVPSLLATGTTAVVTESSSLGLLFGSRGVETLLERTADGPLTTYVTVPPQWFIDTFDEAKGGDRELEELASLLEHDRVVGVGEIDWIHVVGRDAPVEALYERACEAGARIVGHGAGCRGDALRAFATIVDNDHEAISAEGIRQRAANGIHVVGRCGTVRDDLEAVIEASFDVDLGSVSLSTDGVWPRELRDGFGMHEVVRRLIDAGVPVADAIDAATRNTAEHFGLDGRGVVAPGAVADLVVVDGLEEMSVEAVVAEGSIVVSDGVPTIDPRSDPYPEYVYDTVSVDIERGRFTVPCESGAPDSVRAMAVDQGLVTTETTVEPGYDAQTNRLVPAPKTDALTATLMDRDPTTPDRRFTGFLTGFGLETGAVATTVTWEVPGLVTVAAESDDATIAAERVMAMGGGFAVANDGEIVADLAMPVAATAADAPVEAVADDFDAVERALRELGSDVDRPLLTLQTLTFPGVPALKLTPSGYADVLGRSVVGLGLGLDRDRDPGQEE